MHVPKNQNEIGQRNPEKDSVLEALLHEYDQIAGYSTTISQTSFRLIPVFFTIGAAVIAYASTNPLIPLAIPYGIFFFGIWLGFIHAMDNGVGLHMVCLEQKINRRLSVDRKDGVSFFGRFLANSGLLLGFNRYLWILGIFVLMTLIISFRKSWLIMTAWNWQLFYKLAVIILPLVLNVFALIVVILAENETRRRKLEVIKGNLQFCERNQE